MQQASHHEVLKALARFESGASFADFQSRFTPGLLGELAQTLDNLRKAQFVAELSRNGQLCYEITAQGRKILGAKEEEEAPAPIAPTQSLPSEEAQPPAPVEIRRCRPHSVTTVCLEEVDLDDWWREQDVEQKGEIFLLWCLGSGSVINEDEEEPQIPIEGAISAGTIGGERRATPKADPEVISRLREAIRGGDSLGQADGCGQEGGE